MNKFLATAGVFATLAFASTGAFAGDMKDQGPINTNPPAVAAHAWAPAEDVNGDIYPVIVRNEQTAARTASPSLATDLSQLAQGGHYYEPISQ